MNLPTNDTMYIIENFVLGRPYTLKQFKNVTLALAYFRLNKLNDSWREDIITPKDIAKGIKGSPSWVIKKINSQKRHLTMKIISRKIGSNRGNKRIWIEGKSLTEYGWVKGTLYVKDIYEDGTIYLQKNDYAKKTLKIAGGEDRPVIDLNGKYVTAAFKGCEKVRVRITEASITISGALS